GVSHHVGDGGLQRPDDPPPGPRGGPAAGRGDGGLRSALPRHGRAPFSPPGTRAGGLASLAPPRARVHPPLAAPEPRAIDRPAPRDTTKVLACIATEQWNSKRKNSSPIGGCLRRRRPIRIPPRTPASFGHARPRRSDRAILVPLFP